MKRNLLIFAVLVSILGAAAVQAAPGKPLTDQWIEGRIQGALDFNSYFDSTDMTVNVENGKVTFSGKVPSETERQFAESVASRIDGVTSVTNRLEVDEKLAPRNRSELAQFISDLTTSTVVKSKLAANRNTSALDIKVDSKNGLVTLSGTVRSKEEKDLAERIALNTHGTSDVENELKIANPQGIGDKVENKMVDVSRSVSDAWISTKVRTILGFSSEFPGSTVSVNTEKGKVVLEGKVRSAEQKQQIEEQVAQVVGVHEVENKLVIRRNS